MKFLLSAAILGLYTLSVAVPLVHITPADFNLTEKVDGATKRGLAFNDPALTHLFGGTKVSWMYNWSHMQNGGAGYEYVPMLWSNRGDMSVWQKHVDFWAAEGNRVPTTHLLGFNEPEVSFGGGSNMPDLPGTAWAYKDLITSIKARHPKMKIGSPGVTNGVRDPATGHAMGLEWLKTFYRDCADCQIDFTAVHWYDSPSNTEYFKNHLWEAYYTGGKRPLWVTEFGFTSGSEAEQIQFLKQMLPWMDSQHWIERYALFMCAEGLMVSPDGNSKSSLGAQYASI
ncbi:hypothetical protein CC78DRAFT_534426 [Lojkania enalia]|uniref:Asl1-like glycosyl hydrolase catalytic domain-containing protein n=1 Tax=Lojkania enalia TaxID=147567 RepID=A0A9P4KB90_9PLEO|nr:hypothetical protein CC78DRAFT_534426 [Didymosphaeria enalia]